MVHKIDSSTTVATMPTPLAVGNVGWFAHGSGGTGTPYTVVTSDFLNSIQAELLAVLAAAAITPSKTNNSQLLTAISALILAAIAAHPGQTLGTSIVDQTASRAYGTTYTNTTGRPIFVSSSGGVTTAGGLLEGVVNGSVFFFGPPAAGGTGSGFNSVTIFFCVPVGASYEIVASPSGGTTTKVNWVEM